jgi:HKD family nuclease
MKKQILLFIASFIVFAGCSHSPVVSSKNNAGYAQHLNLRHPAATAGATKTKTVSTEKKKTGDEPAETNTEFTANPPDIVDSFYSPPDASFTTANAASADTLFVPKNYSSTDDPSLGHLPVVQQMNKAKPGTPLHMEIFNLSDRDVAQALVTAKKRGVDVTVIIDHDHYCTAYPNTIQNCPKTTASRKPVKNNGRLPAAESTNPTRLALDLLKEGDVTLIPSTPKFSITHVKSFSYVDQEDGEPTLVVMSMNQTTKAAIIRDFAVVTKSQAAYNEFEATFAKDIQNAKDSTKNEAELTDANLAWSPVNSQAKLVALVDSAPEGGEIDLTVEEFTQTSVDLTTALENAAKERHVKVRVLVPLCQDPTAPVFGENKYNIGHIIDLNKYASDNKVDIDARGLRGPPTPTNPYQHQKMIVVRDTDGAPMMAYVGSINFSKNSFEEARELGIVFPADNGGPASEALNKLVSNFSADWNGNSNASLNLGANAQAIKLTAEKAGLCSK